MLKHILINKYCVHENHVKIKVKSSVEWHLSHYAFNSNYDKILHPIIYSLLLCGGFHAPVTQRAEISG